MSISSDKFHPFISLKNEAVAFGGNFIFSSNVIPRRTVRRRNDREWKICQLFKLLWYIYTR